MTDSPHIAWIIFIVLASIVFLIQVWMHLRTSMIVRSLDRHAPKEPDVWPTVSLIVPAANEEKKIEKALLSKLESDYPNLEIILIDDRSTDSTGVIIDKIGKQDPRVKTIHILELSDGWLGKPHALNMGVKHASGEIFLFTDADVHFSKDAIRKAVALLQERQLDHLGMVPRFWTNDFLLNVVFLTFIRAFVVVAGYWGIDYKWLKAFTGVGAFNMVRRETFEKTEGFAWLKLDIADDVALAMMIRNAGGKTWVAAGDMDLYVEWYGTLGEFARGIERPVFASGGNFSMWETWIKTALFAVGDLFMFVVPFFILTGWIQWLCVFLILAGTIASIGLMRWGKGPILNAFFWPIGTIIFTFIWFRAGWVGWRRGGVEWRSTFYPSKMLKKGRRIRILDF